MHWVHCTTDGNTVSVTYMSIICKATFIRMCSIIYVHSAVCEECLKDIGCCHTTDSYHVHYLHLCIWKRFVQLMKTYGSKCLGLLYDIYVA